jgi:pantoate--beta-alanine ligase
VIELSSVGAMRAWSRDQRRANRRIGCVPTMGYLHEGHLRLVDRARQLSDAVAMSIFVNPLQFGPREDLARYPRDLPRDRAAAEARGVDCLFVPAVAEMYPVPARVTVDPGDLAGHLCGPRRPGHFAGVLTVVAKLFHVIEPDVAVFGRKDAQQAQLIRRMAADLSFAVEIDVLPTVREADGLALSSRNVYLTPEQRRAAAAIPRALEAGHAAFHGGTRAAAAVVQAVAAVLASAPSLTTEYVEAVDPDTLTPIDVADARTLLAVAVRAGDTRLIDNIILGEGLARDLVLHG